MRENIIHLTKFSVAFILFLPCVLGMNIKLKEGNNTFTVYENDTLDEFFYYQKNSDICDCSPKMNYFEYANVNRTKFVLSDYDTIEKIIVSSSNPIINTKFTFDNSSDLNAILNVEHYCSLKALNDKDKYWGIIKIEIYKSLETMQKLKFEFVKFCAPPELMGSILTIIILFAMSTAFVGISTYSEISLELTEVKPEGEIKYWHGIILIVSGSLVLILIFYFLKYINVFFTLLITFQIGLAFYLCAKTFYEFLGLPKHKKFVKLNEKVPFVDMECYSFILMIITTITVSVYLMTRHWILNNVFGFCLVFTILSLFHIRSLKICSIILFSAFLYDVFWVYFSPFFFKQNVMVVAATSMNLPIKLEMPILFDTHPLKSCMFLGLGDLVLPGLVIKFCHRFDFIKNTHIYYISSIILYMFALFLSGLVIAIFKAPQPVLFYMCPVLLIGISLISYCRNESDIWHADLLEENLNLQIIFEQNELGMGMENINIMNTANMDLESRTELSFTDSQSNSSDEK